ncbi:MAG: diapolycopene oxygenase [Candidatus Sumerlaeota bacterium]|nr:diapolycopene oxygenase [Candidatus Sumerlaeota bacterium]
MKVVVDKNLEGAHVIVVGSGIAGLSAAIALSARGARVRVLERAADPGGRWAPLEADGFATTLADPIVTQPHVLGQLFALANLRLSDFLEFRAVDPFLRLVFADGATFDVHAEREAFAAEVALSSDAEAERLGRLWPRWEKSAHNAAETVFTVPGEGNALFRRLLAFPAGWPLAAAALTPWRGPRFSPHHFPKAPLPAVFDALAHSWGATAGRAAPQFRVALLNDLLHGAWVPTAGPRAVLDALLRVCQLNGIRIVTGACVRSLNIENGVVRHVAGDGFKTLRADIVISTIGIAETLETLVPACEDRTRALRRLRRQRPSRSAFLLFLRCRRRWPLFDETPRLLLVPGERLEMNRQIDHWRVPAAKPPILVTNLSALNGTEDGETLLRLDVPMPPVSDRFRWSPETISAERARLLLRLEQHGADGLTDSIMAEAVLSPADVAARLGGGDGALFGPSAHRLNGWLTRPAQQSSEFRGLFFAGVDAHPGPGLPHQVLGGMLAAERAADAWQQSPPLE